MNPLEWAQQGPTNEWPQQGPTNEWAQGPGPTGPNESPRDTFRTFGTSRNNWKDTSGHENQVFQTKTHYVWACPKSVFREFRLIPDQF